MLEKRATTLELARIKDAEELRRIVKERRKPAPPPPPAPAKTP